MRLEPVNGGHAIGFGSAGSAAVFSTDKVDFSGRFRAVVGGAKLYGEASGRNSLEGRAKATADAIAGQLKIRFQDRGWISQP